MSDKTIGYLNGDFDYEGGSLIFSCSKIELNLSKQEDVQGVITVTEQAGKIFQGSFYSSQLRMHCMAEHFEGEDVRLGYYFDAQGMEPGDVLKGNFYIVSDMGEYMVPYVVTMLHENIESSLGSIKNLFHFTNLAKSSWDEAVKVFAREQFEEILTGNDAKYRNLYRGLKRGCNKNRCLEEFLIGINKKQKIEYVLDREAVKLENPENVVSQTVKIERNGWGYTHLQVKTDGAFLIPEKEELTDNDFLGNSCHFTFYVRQEALHNGKNYGRIILKDAYESLTVTVTVYQNSGRKSLVAHKSKSMVYSLTRHYLDFRMKKISLSKWLLLTQELIDHRKNMEVENAENALFEAQLLITQERFNEAKWILDHQVENPEELNDTLYCYYLYLTTLYNVDEYYTREMADRVAHIYGKDRKNWRIAWLLLYLSGELNKNSTQKVGFAIEQLEKGCYSPAFYLEVLNLYNSNPSLLNKLNETEKRVLLFGAKEQILSADLMQQITYLAMRVKNFDQRLYQILSLMYEKKQDDETVQAICILLMKGNKVGTAYFPWYERAVISNFPITRLYEYYMMSMDLLAEPEIPKRVLMYFSYQSDLNTAQNAYLYSYLVKNRGRYADLYETYFPQMSRFLLKQLYGGKVDGNLAYLYQEVVMQQLMTPDNARQLAAVLMIHCVRVEEKNIVNVVVIDDRIKGEISYPVTGSKAYIQLCGNEYTVLLEDEGGNRYYNTRSYSMERFFLPRKIIASLEPYAQHSIFFDLFVCDGSRDFIVVTPQNVNRCRYLEQSQEISVDFAQAIRMHLIQYYFERDEIQRLDELLGNIAPQDVLVRDQKELVRFLAIRGFYHKAFEFILYYGTDHMEAKTVGRVCSTILAEEGLLEETQMTYAVYSAFSRGKYNEILLQYLMKFYKGSAKNLRDIWKAAVNFELDTYDICEKIILQTLETGAFIGEEKAIFKQYVSGGGKTEVELAYLSCCAYEYLTHERVIDEFVIRDMERIYLREKDISKECMLAYLKFFEQKVDELDDQSSQTAEEFIHCLYIKNHMLMPFFQAYRNISTEAEELTNMTLIEYKGNPQSTVVIHYAMLGENGGQSGFIKEEMKSMYAGIFVKPFWLFFGETLQYYITEEYGNKEQLTESGTIQKSDALQAALQSRYAMINDIAVADTLKDYETAKQLIYDYEYKKYMTEELFKPQ